MQGRFEEMLSPDQDSASEVKISRGLQEQLRLSYDFCEEERKEIIKDRDNGEDEEEEEEEEEFSFMCGEGDTSPIAAEDAFLNGKIRPVFPLFNRDLFFSGDEPDFLQLESLPSKPPVKNVFVETRDSGEMTSSSTRNDDILGPCCEWSNRKAVEVSPETCKKSNSTGFSKLWRFKELMGRSNSDGRDTFVFLNNGGSPPTKVDNISAGVKATAVKVRKGGKSKTASLSAHEVYLKSKAKEEEKRRSYLPYRPELMGFFTNANSGLSKNIHPF
ncbi:uncharacterized protein [Primulina huaijiensis]|uniref:uncharacterized protein n=1 Tax=Primulina huaijiensis TaxID=1492673 RepID=UPI003CC72CD4